MNELVNYIPIITTLFAAYFTKEIYNHYLERRKTYLLWWTLGVLAYGLGTLAESIHALFGWNAMNLRFWYITGALLGGFPLAQGSVYLLFKKRFADITATLLVLIIIVVSVFVILTPLSIPPDFNYKLTGHVFAWKWVLYFVPFINLYAFIFLVGGAIYSAVKYYKMGDRRARFKGNIFIAAGGLLPGIGGTFTRMGYVEVLFITELVGLILIYAGYKIIRTEKKTNAA